MDSTKSLPFTKGNSKLGPNVKTWSRVYGTGPDGTCPITCALLNIAHGCAKHIQARAGCAECELGCYADGIRGVLIRNMAAGARNRAEFIPPISTLSRAEILRLHVSGDFGLAGSNGLLPDIAYIESIRAELVRLRATYPDPVTRPVVFTYAHAWRQWAELGPLRPLMHINASCDTAADVTDAVASGWRVAYHGADVDLGQSYHHVNGHRLLVFPGPQQREITPSCEACGVCWTSSPRYAGVAFSNH